MKNFTVRLLVATLCVVGTTSVVRAKVPDMSTPHAGAACKFGDMQSAPIGFPMGAADSPGIHGNEVKQVYRIFYAYKSVGGGVAFAGWLLASFDGRYFYNPTASSKTHAIGIRSVAVVPKQAENLPLSEWAKTLLSKSNGAEADEVRAIASATIVSTALSPCFGSEWSSKK
ncbi:MAG: hypothetical protein NVSMB31_12910 [Vulcanimicrobiaceae bacterium]